MAKASTTPIFPKFSAPIFQENRLIFTSPDGKRLLCVSLEGKNVWERKFDVPARLFTGPNSEAHLQTGRIISSISPQSGVLHAKFTLEDENAEVTFSSMIGAFVSRSVRLKKRTLKLLDGKSGQPLWTTPEIEGLVCATPELIVGLAVQRIPNRRGYSFGKASLDGYDRKSFERKWRVPLSDEAGLPYPFPTFKAPYLIYAEDRTSLAVLDCANGRKRLSRKLEVPEYGRIINLTISGDQLLWLTRKTAKTREFNNTEQILHFCTIPDLNEDKTVILKMIGIVRISLEAGFIMAETVSRTACFLSGGEKVWEGFQVARTQVINNRIYFSDHQSGTARLCFVEFPTGKETTLYSEQVVKPKR